LRRNSSENWKSKIENLATLQRLELLQKIPAKTEENLENPWQPEEDEEKNDESRYGDETNLSVFSIRLLHFSPFFQVFIFFY
jgi:hypothetical protein